MPTHSTLIVVMHGVAPTHSENNVSEHRDSHLVGSKYTTSAEFMNIWLWIVAI